MRKQKIHFQLYKGRDKQWHWRAVRSGHIKADGGEGFKRPSGANKSMRDFVQAIMFGNCDFEKLG